MTISDEELDATADRLFEAYRDGRATAPPSGTLDLDIADAYRLQSATLDRRNAAPIGYKLGFTNDRIRDQIGVDRPASGRLLDDAVLEDGIVAADELVDPRFEPEIGFVLDGLSPPVFDHDVLSATRAVVPAVEIVDSRTTDGWSLSPADAIADNALASRVAVGARSASVDDRDLSMEAVQVRKNGRLIETGVGANALEHPVRAVRWLANERAIEAGSLVLTGSLTPALPFESGDTIEVRFSTLGSVSVRAD